MAEFSGRTVLMSGGSRGIGLAIAVRLAQAGADIAIVAKTDEPHPCSRARSTPPPRRSATPADGPCRSWATSATRRRSRPRWLRNHSAYTLSKYGMTMLTLGVAADERDHGIAANCLWPRTLIATAAVRNLLGGQEMAARARSPRIVADAAFAILRQPPAACAGRSFIDDEVLATLADPPVTDLSAYAAPDAELALDLFVDDWGPTGPPR